MKALEASDPERLKTAVSELKLIIADPGASPELRRTILQRLAAFVRDRAPALPVGPSFEYCLQPPTTRMASEVQSAMEAIGSRAAQDSDVAIDLTGINLAYANLQALDLSNVQLDGALMCRSFLDRARLSSATLRTTNLRFSFMKESLGLEADQLVVASTLYRAVLPTDLEDLAELQARVLTDPELSQ